MPTAIRQVLGGQNLTGTLQAVTPRIPFTLPEGLKAGGANTSRVEGDVATYYKVNGTRKTAQQVAYGSPSVARSMQGVTEETAKLVHSAENINLKAATLVNLQSTDGVRQRLGEQVVAQHVQESRDLLENLRTAMLYSAFGLGAIHFAGGQLLPSNSGAAISVDFGIPAGNLNQLAVFGTDLIDATWNTDTTKIMENLKKIRDASVKLTGYPLVHAIYGENIPYYILKNAQAKELVNRHTPFQASFLSNIIPNGFAELNWWSAGQMFYEDQNGTIQSFVGADEIVFFPDPSLDWFGWFEGSAPILSDPSVTTDLSSALASATLATGMYSYAYMTPDPVTAKMVYGDTSLPVIKVPGCVFRGDVTP